MHIQESVGVRLFTIQTVNTQQQQTVPGLCQHQQKCERNHFGPLRHMVDIHCSTSHSLPNQNSK